MTGQAGKEEYGSGSYLFRHCDTMNCWAMRTSGREPRTRRHTLLVTRTGANEYSILYNIRGFTPTDSAITSYTYKQWHRRYFLNREVSYWLQSCMTGSAFRGFTLILQKRPFHVRRYENVSKQDGCIDTRYSLGIRNFKRLRSFRCLLRSDWVIAPGTF